MRIKRRPRDPVSLIGAYLNFQERDDRKILIKLSTDQELTITLSVFQCEKLRKDIYKVRAQQLVRPLEFLESGQFPKSTGPEIIEIDDGPAEVGPLPPAPVWPGFGRPFAPSPDTGFVSDSPSEESDEV